MRTDQPELASVAAALPGYEIGEELGKGSYGVVLGGRHIQLGRDVAIKQLSTELSAQADVRRRFTTEAQLLASFTHPHIVPIYDYVERDGLCLLVMERLPAGTVWQQFRLYGMTIETACVVVMATCSALHYAHGRGVLHRDVKPDNLLVSSDKALKVTDFGIAEVFGGKETLATRSGEILGTPAYMAPEQAVGREVDPRADVYATGVVLYELLSGRLPFSAEGDALDVAARHISEPPPPLAVVAPQIPAPLADVAMRALAKAPEDRFPSAEAFGVAVAEAATAACGPEWMARAELSLMAPGPILAAAEQTAPAGNGGARATGMYTSADLARVGLTPRPRVRPEEPNRAGPAPAPAPADLVPIAQVIKPTRSPRIPQWLALALSVATILVALVGLGGGGDSDRFEAGAATIQGQDAAGAVTLDFAEPVPLVVRNDVAGDATEAELSLSVMSVDVSDPLTASLTEGTDGRTAEFDLNEELRYLVPGEVTGEIRLAGAGTDTIREFTAEQDGLGILTVPGAVSVGVAMFVAAYAESHLRLLRRGRRRAVWVLVALPVLGAVAGADVLALAWVFGAGQPTVPGLIVCALLGAGAGLAFALAAVRRNRGRRRTHVAPTLATQQFAAQ